MRRKILIKTIKQRLKQMFRYTCIWSLVFSIAVQTEGKSNEGMTSKVRQISPGYEYKIVLKDNGIVWA